VSRFFDYLRSRFADQLPGAEAGSKLSKAESLEVPVLDEDGLLKVLRAQTLGG